MLGKKSVINGGLFFASGVESDAAPAIGFIISWEWRRIGYQFCLLKSNERDIDLNVNVFPMNNQTASLITQKDLAYFSDVSTLSYDAIHLLKEYIGKSYINITIILTGNDMTNNDFSFYTRMIYLTILYSVKFS